MASKKEYFDIIEPKFLSWEFIEPYTTKEPPFGSLGLVVYLRTYSRYIPELKRREGWWETVLRVVEYSMSLYNYKFVPEEIKFPEMVEEAQLLFEYMFNLKVFAAGRTLWTANTPVVKQDGSANFNCSFRVIDSLNAYVEILHLLLVGAGVGFSVEKKYVEQVPKFNQSIQVVHEEYNELPKEAREEHTYTTFSQKTGKVTIEVGDSKSGWETALYEFLHFSVKEDVKSIVINYDSVRPAGERLKTMGGRASGPMPLRKMFEDVEYEIKQAPNGKLTSVQALGISNAIAAMVVVGGVRRSSQIALGDIDDNHFIEAKKNLWTDPAKARYQSTRTMSNNSVHLWIKPTLSKLKEIFNTMKTEGEPGLFNAENASRRRPNYAGTNPLMLAA